MSGFAKGNVVELKSGGPLMTVTYVSNDGSKVQCHWFPSQTATPVFDDFPPEALKKIRE